MTTDEVMRRIASKLSAVDQCLPKEAEAAIRGAVDEVVSQAVAAERERCAVVAETLPFGVGDMDDGRSAQIAAAIRGVSQ